MASMKKATIHYDVSMDGKLQCEVMGEPDQVIAGIGFILYQLCKSGEYSIDDAIKLLHGAVMYAQDKDEKSPAD